MWFSSQNKHKKNFKRKAKSRRLFSEEFALKFFIFDSTKKNWKVFDTGKQTHAGADRKHLAQSKRISFWQKLIKLYQKINKSKLTLNF